MPKFAAPVAIKLTGNVKIDKMKTKIQSRTPREALKKGEVVVYDPESEESRRVLGISDEEYEGWKANPAQLSDDAENEMKKIMADIDKKRTLLKKAI